MAVIINNTTHSIRILFFKNDVVFSDNTVRISQNQQFEIASGTQEEILKLQVLHQNILEVIMIQ